MSSMELNFFDALKAAGYAGYCSSEDILRQALRLGAASWQYEMVIEWLEVHLHRDQEVFACMEPIIKQMYRSTLDQSPQCTTQQRPYEWRCKAMELLVGMVCISQRRQKLMVPYPRRSRVNFGLESSTPARAIQIDLTWIVVDRSKATGSISEKNVDIFVTALEETIANEGSAVSVHRLNIGCVEDCPGLHLIRCRDFKQVSDMLLAFGTLPSLWQGEDLCLLPRSMSRKYMFSSAWLSVRRPYGTSENLLDKINEQNNMKIKSLGFVSYEEDDKYLLKLSPTEMMRLRRTEGKLKLGDGSINLRMNQDMGTWTKLDDLQESNNDE